VKYWDDAGYKTHLRAFISDHDWMDLKKEILRIYSEHKAKREILYNLVKCNFYRSMALTTVECYLNAFNRSISFCCCLSRLSDSSAFMKCLFCILIIPIGYVHLFVFLLLFTLIGAVDIITFPRFILFKENHKDFIEAVMNANPDLDPEIIDDQCVIALKEFAARVTNKYPGVNCVFSSATQHIPYSTNGNSPSIPSHDVDFYQLNFLKFPPIEDIEGSDFNMLVVD